MIKDGSLPNSELRSELAALRQRVAELENDMEDRRVVEEALKESEERFRLIFDELGDGLLVADKETKKFVMGNATIHRMLGYTAEELCRIGIADIHPEQDLPWVIDRFDELARKEIQIARNIPVRRKSGSVFYADISSSFPIVLNKKKCLMGVFRDITERRQAEEAVRESQALLSATIESMPFEFWAIGEDGRYILANGPCIRHYGDILGRKPEEICPNQEVLSIWEDNNRRAFRGELVEGEVRSVFGEEEVTYHNIIAPIRDGDQIRGLLGMNIDIGERKKMEEELRRAYEELESRVRERTADLERVNEALRAEIARRKQTEEALREAERKFRSLFENAREGIYQSTPEGKYFTVNPAMAREYGYASPEEMIIGIDSIDHQIFVIPEKRQEMKRMLTEER